MTPDLDHVTITAHNLSASSRFYDAALGALGIGRVVELVDEEQDAPDIEAIGWGRDGRAVLWVVAGERPTSGVHLRLRAADRTAVEAFHADAVAAGGVSHDAPRRWPIYRAGEFNATVGDPDGNLIEAVGPEA